jgi:uncharacterized membrane protein
LNHESPVYRHHGNIFLIIFGLLLAAITVFLLIGATEVAFQRLGFSRLHVILILVTTFAGSLVNIPLRRIKSAHRILEIDEIQFFWIKYRIPHLAVRETSTLIAVNLGGAIIPLCVSLYLMTTYLEMIPQAALGVLLTATLVHLVTRKVPGLGIATPAFVPPLVAALIAYVLYSSTPNIIDYISGTLGTLIGADLTNLREIGRLGAPVVSIGGAGTFDGVFLTGIIAVPLV